MDYTIVDVQPDTDAWLEERRASIGASEIAAVMGLSPWQTALDVYKSKHGAGNTFDPVLSMIGHESEVIIHKWVAEFSGIGLSLEPSGFMARSVEFPFIHATFDRYQADPFITCQFKTAHQYTSHKWDEGIPTDIRIQVQAEMLVARTLKALVVVWIGGREFRYFWEQFDHEFVHEHMIPTVAKFWDDFQNDIPPLPMSLGEVNEVWPSEDKSVEADAELFDKIGQRALLLSDIQEMEKEADELKLHIANFMQEADTLTFGGKKVLTFKTQKGRSSFDKTRFESEHPDLAAAYTTQGANFRVMRTMKGALSE